MLPIQLYRWPRRFKSYPFCHMTLLDFLLVGLATWRLSSLILYEEGPFAIFERVRTRAGVNRPGEVTSLATLFSCMWCMSVWIGGLCSAMLALGDVGHAFLLILSASSVAIIINRSVSR